jgi:1,4-dihydroxy-2-naphthoate octaprenyltransferase
MSNTAKLLAALLIVLALFMVEILVELLMPIAWVVLIAIPLVFGYLIRELYRAGKGRF